MLSGNFPTNDHVSLQICSELDGNLMWLGYRSSDPESGPLVLKSILPSLNTLVPPFRHKPPKTFQAFIFDPLVHHPT
jgi:hypothetical protein